MKDPYSRPSFIPALRVHQWLPQWDDVEFDEAENRRKPAPEFFLFTLRASELLSLSVVPWRTLQNRAKGGQDLGIQRRHDPERSDEIRSYVEFGYPLSSLKNSLRPDEEFRDLQKPGWLPSAIVVNILSQGDVRDGSRVADDDLISVKKGSTEALSEIHLPEAWSTTPKWHPSELAPIEVIDGQHRLLAFRENAENIDIDLPVVAFYGLDISWAAYLFWTINIRPKRINPSLAFDLYPLLRTEDWLERAEGNQVYRETRAQELTEVLWSFPGSSWKDRINMLGETGTSSVTQASWIRSLVATYVKPWEGKRVSIGGLFGSRIIEGDRSSALSWTRPQQAAFLIMVWEEIRVSVRDSDAEWARTLRQFSRRRSSKSFDPAFAGQHTLLSTDQGVRAILFMSNDLCFLLAETLRLRSWKPSFSDAETVLNESIEEQSVSEALQSLDAEPVHEFIGRLSALLAEYDWRTSAAPELTELEKSIKLGFRGSGGYRELRRQLLLHLSGNVIDKEIASVARSASVILGYEQ